MERKGRSKEGEAEGEREVGGGFIADSGGEKGRVREKREKKGEKKLKKIEEKD